MKTFKQFIEDLPLSEIADPLPKKIASADKKEIARMTSQEVEQNMVKKYQLPTKVV